MDKRQKIKLKRVAPAACAGSVLVILLLYLFVNMGPDKTLERNVEAIIDEYGFVQIGSVKQQIGSGEAMLVTAYAADRLDKEDVLKIQSDIVTAVGGPDVVEVAYSSSIRNDSDVRTIVTPSKFKSLVRVEIQPEVRINGEGEIMSGLRLTRRKHPEYGALEWLIR